MRTSLRTHRTLTVALLAVATTAFAACGGGTGSPADGEVRTVQISATDALRFEPSTVQVAVGETVRFVVVNQGATEHEFAIGDDSTAGMFTSSGMMDGGMGSMDGGMGSMGGGMPSMGGGMSHGEGTVGLPLPGNATVELTVTFQEAGSIPFACHLNGHDEAGMTGTISVT